MKYIKTITFLLILHTMFLMPKYSHAQTERMNIGILNNYNFTGNTISDYSQSCMNAVSDYIIYSTVSYSETNQTNGIVSLENGDLDALCMIPISSALSAKLDYTSEPIGTGFFSLYTNSDKEIYYEDFEEFKDMKIGILNDSYSEEYLSDYAQKNNFSYTLQHYTNIDELISATKSNLVDAIFIPSTADIDNLRLIAKCGRVNYYCAVKKGNSDALNTLNTAISDLKIDDPFYLGTSYKNYFKQPYLNVVRRTEDENIALNNHKKLRIFASDNNYPLSYFDNDSNQYDGVYHSIIQKVAEISGFELEFISYDISEMSMHGIVMGKIDAILTVSGSTQGLVTATEPYTTISYVPIGKKDVNIFEDSPMNVGILSNDSWIINNLNTTHSNWNIEKYTSTSSLLHAVEKGNISIALLSSIDVQTKTSLVTRPKLSLITDFDISVPVCLGVSNITCNQTIIDLLDKSIRNVSVPEAEFESRVYNLSNAYVPTFRDVVYSSKHLGLIALLILALILFIINMNKRHYKKIALTDTLTQIPNKQYFISEALKIMDKNHSQPYLLVSLDASNFKLINDYFGHSVGDQTLIKIASKIKDKFKGIGLYARSQSDNFLVLVEDTPANRELVASLIDLDICIHTASNYKVPIKIGVCPIPHFNPAVSISRYLDRASIAKKYVTGRNTNNLEYFTDEMENQLGIKNAIESEMLQALNRGDFIVHYQPKYDLSSDKIIGAEALVRWNNKERGMILPGIFIPQFEKNGFIVDLDFYVYESVIQMLRKRIDNNEPLIPISMNVSRCHLTDINFVEKLDALVNKYNVPKKYIEIEITESIFSQGDTDAIALILKLKKFGFTVSMDDFGSGYSSLGLLHEVPIDILKIDKTFIDNVDSAQKSRVIVEEIISMASKIRVKTICEGVETKSQRDFLKNAGCNMAQGYLYSKPLPYESFSALLNSSN